MINPSENDQSLAGYNERVELAIQNYGTEMAGYLNRQTACMEMKQHLKTNKIGLADLSEEERCKLICDYFQGTELKFQQSS